jgi:DNA-binding transcriptional MerR regulator
MPASDNLKMKDLEARTGLTRQAIHFYLREGLLPEPERPKRNVAHYSEEHVDRIKLIKRLQEEKFLPLGVIKTCCRTRILMSKIPEVA